VEKNIIPIVIGVTGHRNIVREDRELLAARVENAIREILSLCKNGSGEKVTPVIMLNGFAQGADMLCAEVAFGLGVPVYAVLPCQAEEYALSFDDEGDRAKLKPYLARSESVIVAPDIENAKKRLIEEEGVDKQSYAYRQVGVYIAKNSRFLIALWDGKPPKTRFGCGTAEVIGFSLEGNYFHGGGSPDCGEHAVIWVKARRQGDGSRQDVKTTYVFTDGAAQGQTAVRLFNENATGYFDRYRVSEKLPAFMLRAVKKIVDENDDR